MPAQSGLDRRARRAGVLEVVDEQDAGVGLQGHPQRLALGGPALDCNDGSRGLLEHVESRAERCRPTADRRPDGENEAVGLIERCAQRRDRLRSQSELLPGL